MYRLTSSTEIERIADGAIIPADADNADYAAYLAWLADGNTPEPYEVPEPSPAELIASMQAAVQARLDTFARTRYYDGILSACTYAGDPIPRFASDGQRCIDLRGATWDACNTVLAEIQAGERPMPTEAELLAALPELTWEA